jgi:hypothetical protein
LEPLAQVAEQEALAVFAVLQLDPDVITALLAPVELHSPVVVHL